MPTGVYVRTAEHRRINSESHKGQKPSTETVEKLKEAWTDQGVRERRIQGNKAVWTQEKRRLAAEAKLGNFHHLTHGLSGHEHYARHYTMMYRCYKTDSQSYKWYGGRGITVCDEWHDVAVFCQWMDENMGPCPPGHSFNRIDNDGSYSPDNVNWATQTEQVRNSRVVR